jgi:hypothetical protein
LVFNICHKGLKNRQDLRFGLKKIDSSVPIEIIYECHKIFISSIRNDRRNAPYITMHNIKAFCSTTTMVAGQSGDDPFSARSMDATQNSVGTVPELGNGVDTAGTGRSGTDPVEGEMLNLALEDGEIMGMTSDGQPGQLKEILGKIIAGDLGRGIGGERGNFVINES